MTADIERMAREADPWPALEAMARQCIAEDWDKPAPGYYRNMNIARFAALVRAQALEDAARACDQIDLDNPCADSYFGQGCADCAAAIRALATQAQRKHRER